MLNKELVMTLRGSLYEKEYQRRQSDDTLDSGTAKQSTFIESLPVDLKTKKHTIKHPGKGPGGKEKAISSCAECIIF